MSNANDLLMAFDAHRVADEGGEGAWYDYLASWQDGFDCADRGIELIDAAIIRASREMRGST